MKCEICGQEAGGVCVSCYLKDVEALEERISQLEKRVAKLEGRT